jgi:hypothetical protein
LSDNENDFTAESPDLRNLTTRKVDKSPILISKAQSNSSFSGNLLDKKGKISIEHMKEVK